MKTELIKKIYNKYNLERSDVFRHQHYIIITRSGIEKIIDIENIFIRYDVLKLEPRYAGVKAIAIKGEKTLETLGSAYKGETFKDGNTNSWYVLEMAQKRAMARATLEITGMYKLGFFGEDESEDFKKSNNK